MSLSHYSHLLVRQIRIEDTQSCYSQPNFSRIFPACAFYYTCSSIYDTRLARLRTFASLLTVSLISRQLCQLALFLILFTKQRVEIACMEGFCWLNEKSSWASSRIYQQRWQLRLSRWTRGTRRLRKANGLAEWIWNERLFKYFDYIVMMSQREYVSAQAQARSLIEGTLQVYQNLLATRRAVTPAS